MTRVERPHPQSLWPALGWYPPEFYQQISFDFSKPVPLYRKAEYGEGNNRRKNIIEAQRSPLYLLEELPFNASYYTGFYPDYFETNVDPITLAPRDTALIQSPKLLFSSYFNDDLEEQSMGIADSALQRFQTRITPNGIEVVDFQAGKVVWALDDNGPLMHSNTPLVIDGDTSGMGLTYTRDGVGGIITVRKPFYDSHLNGNLEFGDLHVRASFNLSHHSAINWANNYHKKVDGHLKKDTYNGKALREVVDTAITFEVVRDE